MPFAPEAIGFGSLPGSVAGVARGTTGQPCLITYDGPGGQPTQRRRITYDHGHWGSMNHPDPVHAAIACRYDGDRIASCVLRDELGSQRVTAHRDAAGRITAIDGTAPRHVTVDPPYHVTYDDRGEVTDEDLGPFTGGLHLHVRYRHDDHHRLIGEQLDRVVAERPTTTTTVTYRYDPRGLVTARTFTSPDEPARDETYRFVDDQLAELTRHAANEPAGAIDRTTVSYDDRGRIRMISAERVVDDQVLDEQNRVLTYVYADTAACR
jgi:YD repeat-containing protein